MPLRPLQSVDYNDPHEEETTSTIGLTTRIVFVTIQDSGGELARDRRLSLSGVL